jgi:uncharacterized protein (TIGR03790 family)
LRGMFSFFTVLALAVFATHGAGLGESVVVIYNQRSAESKKVAEHYAQARKVPAAQIIGLRLPTGESMTRKEYQEELVQPLWTMLEKNKLFTLQSVVSKEGKVRQVVEAKVRYAVLCYGVPLKIDAELGLVEEGSEGKLAALRRNEAAVDTELALLPLMDQKLTLGGPRMSKYYGVTNTALLHPTNGVLMVSRLDGPTPQIAGALVDKAMQAEKEGLWGRAYFDVRGISDGEYKKGDDWIRNASKIAQRFGFETVLDDKPEVFTTAFPMSQIALYAGWYESNVSGPFTRPKVELMPGAIAYHLHSFSAASIRTTNQYWVGPLLAKGVTATMGAVNEPFLDGTPDVATLFHRLLFAGFSFGEAVYAAQTVLSWQITVVGDPLYQPFLKQGPKLHEELEQTKNTLLAWSHLRIVNINLATGVKTDEMIKHLISLPLTRQSSILSEKLGDLLTGAGREGEAADAYVRALRQPTSPQQRTRIALTLAPLQAGLEREDQALETYEAFLTAFVDYPDRLMVCQKALLLADRLKKTELAEKYRREIRSHLQK